MRATFRAVRSFEDAEAVMSQRSNLSGRARNAQMLFFPQNMSQTRFMASGFEFHG